ncbi:reverse transcriptase [Gossypium australe]|uniref:Reverse transcriptase n=1 Tax=Gossypium australe TaxID=47621 RepID=A0A5B6VAI2_9ROSI|nr:reverse transcriptase [Gossypium australe]
MYQDLRVLYWRPSMKREIVELMAKCLTCQQVKAEHQVLTGLLQPISIPQWKLEHITMDFVVGLPLSPNKRNDIWVIVNRFTKTPVCWSDLCKKKVIGVELIQEKENMVKVIRDRLKAASERQKSYADLKQRDIEFLVGDKVFTRRGSVESHKKRLFLLRAPPPVVRKRSLKESDLLHID